MEIRETPLSDLHPYEENAKKHPKKQVDQIARSIKEFGWGQPIVVDKDNIIIVGHGRYWAAQQLGLKTAPVLKMANLTSDQVDAYRLADNKLNESEWDMNIVIEQLKYLDSQDYDITLTGFDKDLTIEADEKDDVIPENPPPIAKIGDLWALGPHRVLCGDSTKMEDVERLMDGKKADMVFTDPPYLMKLEGSVHADGSKSYNSKHGVIKNDALSGVEGEQFLFDFLVNIKLSLRGPWYITFYRLGIDKLFTALGRANLRWRNLVIWRKNNHNLSNSDYKSMYEPMVVGWDDDYVPIFYGWEEKHAWNGRKNERDVWEVAAPSVWEIDKTKRNELHPTMKPVELMTRAISNSSKVGNVVLDPFLGSGSTLIAAEKTGRICYGMELDPKYVDVIIKRWEDYTGKKAEKL